MQHYKRKRRDGEDDDVSAEENQREDGESVDDEEEELDPDEELHIPEVEEEDESFEDWFSRNFPALPEQRVVPGNRRRQRLGILLNIR